LDKHFAWFYVKPYKDYMINLNGKLLFVWFLRKTIMDEFSKKPSNGSDKDMSPGTISKPFQKPSGRTVYIACTQ